MEQREVMKAMEESMHQSNMDQHLILEEKGKVLDEKGKVLCEKSSKKS